MARCNTVGLADNHNWELLDSDREFFERELQSFVPLRIFDTHAHLYAKSHFQGALGDLLGSGPDVVDLGTHIRCTNELMPGRSSSGLFFPFPHAKP